MEGRVRRGGKGEGKEKKGREWVSLNFLRIAYTVQYRHKKIINMLLVRQVLF